MKRIDKNAIYRNVSEKAFMQQIIDAAKLLGYLAYHTHDSRRCQKGFVDLVLTKPGRCIMAELKSEKGKLRPEQKNWIDTLSTCPGMEVYIWRPSDIDTILKILQTP